MALCGNTVDIACGETAVQAESHTRELNFQSTHPVKGSQSTNFALQEAVNPNDKLFYESCWPAITSIA
jgi:hypothetical protein